MLRDIRPKHSTSQVDRAGKKIRKKDFSDHEMSILNNWRGAHNHILNTWQVNLRRRIKNNSTVFAQRLKQRKTILNKLRRHSTMALSTMHDIAGCRLIFENLQALKEYRESLFSNKRFKHYLEKDKDFYDYILNPKDDGYRGVHDVFICQYRDDTGKDWNGLKVEIQYRTKIQHSWATAVEIADTLTGNKIKFGQGSNAQKEFFKLTSEMLARCFENSTSCYANLTNKDLLAHYKKIEREINLLDKLSALKFINSKITISGKTLILHFKAKGEIEIYQYESMAKATEALTEIENGAAETDNVVLVRAGSDSDVKKAYNNYFSDTDDFVKCVKEAITYLENNL